LKRITSRLRRVTGPLPQLDQESVGRVVATGWLRLVGVSIDPRTGLTANVDWRRMRAEASVASPAAASDQLEERALSST
jgi:hypothetical protein